ncbi:transposase [Fimbriiglobus ruber]|uniref:Uncharacterized protein n=1 Tax=Fimbriiglobus ruber TaxID=1908690 RepID=A0A225DFQ2_9BACT|nr:transposase [Fimbriiglobus ruber]OWK37338.1 hypothetical protein FRUB_06458 [Fimbriiglobus ruber]
MDVFENLKRELTEGRIDPGQLLDLVVQLQQQLAVAQQQLAAAQQRIANLEKHLPATTKRDEPYSLRSEEQRQQGRAKKNARKRKPQGRRGRVRTADTIALAERTEAVYPAGVPAGKCRFSHTRVVLVAYDIYRVGNRFGQIPGVLGRSEFGIEIGTQIAYLVTVVGLSFDKTCGLVRFFQNLPLTKSQADALLTQLSRHWEREFDTLCTLLANSAVVHADETSGSRNSVWAFVSEKARVVLFGVHKDAATLARMLDPQTFPGVLVTTTRPCTPGSRGLRSAGPT